MIICKPARYALLGQMYQVVLDNPYHIKKEALKDVDVQEWKRAMDHDIESLGSNLV